MASRWPRHDSDRKEGAKKQDERRDGLGVVIGHCDGVIRRDFSGHTTDPRSILDTRHGGPSI